MPLFAFANAGITLDGDTLRRAATSRITVGIVVGLVVGKPLGIAAAWLAARVRLADRPDALDRTAIASLGTLAGVGFTVSLFIASLAFTDPAAEADANVGILAASVLAAAGGALATRRLPDLPSDRDGSTAT